MPKGSKKTYVDFEAVKRTVTLHRVLDHVEYDGTTCPLLPIPTKLGARSSENGQWNRSVATRVDSQLKVPSLAKSSASFLGSGSYFRSSSQLWELWETPKEFSKGCGKREPFSMARQLP